MIIRRAMLLAAGRSTRLGDLGGGLPKPMLSVGGRPLMAHTVEQLARAGVTDIMVNLHHRGDAIQAYFGDGRDFGVRIAYSEEPELLGTAGGVRVCHDFFAGEPFYVVYGDNLSTCRLDELAAHHAQQGGIATIALFWRDDVSPHSAVAIDGDTRITAFVEKPRVEEAPSHWISAGIIACDARLLARIPARVPCDFGFHVFPALLAGGERLYGYYMTGEQSLWWIDTPEHYAKTCELWKDGIPVR